MVRVTVSNADLTLALNSECHIPHLVVSECAQAAILQVMYLGCWSMLVLSIL